MPPARPAAGLRLCLLEIALVVNVGGVSLDAVNGTDLRAETAVDAAARVDDMCATVRREEVNALGRARAPAKAAVDAGAKVNPIRHPDSNFPWPLLVSLLLEGRGRRLGHQGFGHSIGWAGRESDVRALGLLVEELADLVDLFAAELCARELEAGVRPQRPLLLLGLALA